MIFNNIDLADHLKILEVKKSIISPLEIKSAKMPRSHGEEYHSSTLSPREIGVKVELKKRDDWPLEDNYRNLINILYQDKPKKLIFKNEPDKYYLAKLESSSDIEDYNFFGVMVLNFVCLYPLAMSTQEKIMEDISNKQLWNKGAISTRGTIEVEMLSPVNSLKVELINTGEYLLLEDAFKRGDKVTIDLKKESVEKNGFSAMRQLDYFSDFFEIPKGFFNIKISSGTGSITFREEWL